MHFKCDPPSPVSRSLNVYIYQAIAPPCHFLYVDKEFVCLFSRSQLFLCVWVAASVGQHPGAVGPSEGPHHPDITHESFICSERRVLRSNRGPLYKHRLAPSSPQHTSAKQMLQMLGVTVSSSSLEKENNQ